jgi:hypothetical protein
MYIPTKEEQHLDKLADSMMAADVAFFKRRPDRHHRVRLAHRDEIEEYRLTNPEWRGPPKGYRVYIALWYSGGSDGWRQRAFLPGREGVETDLSEDQARAIYQWGSCLLNCAHIMPPRVVPW